MSAARSHPCHQESGPVSPKAFLPESQRQFHRRAIQQLLIRDDRKRFGEARNFHRVESRKFAARRLKLTVAASVAR